MPNDNTPNLVKRVICLRNFLASEYKDKPVTMSVLDAACKGIIESHFEEVELAIDACKRDFQGRLAALANDLENEDEDGNC